MNQLLQKCSESDEIHVVYDRYDVELSPKAGSSVSGVLQDNSLDQYC